MTAANSDININEINLCNENLETTDCPAEVKTKTKVPRRVLHFSDGVLEEYSTDEDEKKHEDKIVKTDNQLLETTPESLYWSSWFWYRVITFGTSTLSACDYLGEKFAAFFGITTPKYEYEIEYYNSMKAEERDEANQQDLEMGGWAKSIQNVVDTEAVNSSDVTISKDRERY